MLDSLTGILLTLKMGKTRLKSVPYEVIMALTSVQVVDNAKERDGFQLSFSLGKRQVKDYNLLQSGLFDPHTKVSIVLNIRGRPVEPLMSGVIQNIQLGSSNEPGMSSLTVTGEGIESLLDLKEKNEKHERKSDSMIVRRIADIYAKHGVVLRMPKTTEQPDTNRLVPHQYATDLEYLEQTAKRNGFVFYTNPLPTGEIEFYWGPEDRKASIQRALTMNMGAATNVTSLSFSLNGNAPVTTKGDHLQSDSGTRDEPVPPATSFDIKNLAANEISVQRTVLLRDVAKDTISRAELKSKELMIAKFGTITGSGELETVRYGSILKAGETVAVRGVGDLYNGEYYVNKVTHAIERGKYTQKFELTREGLGAKKKRVRNP
jgi:phage protein D